MTDFIVRILQESWGIFVDSSFYMLFGILIAGLLKVFLNPDFISNHLGKGKFSSVFKAAFFGIPLPL